MCQLQEQLWNHKTNLHNLLAFRFSPEGRFFLQLSFLISKCILANCQVEEESPSPQFYPRKILSQIQYFHLKILHGLNKKFQHIHTAFYMRNEFIYIVFFFLCSINLILTAVCVTELCQQKPFYSNFNKTCLLDKFIDEQLVPGVKRHSLTAQACKIHLQI